MDVPLSQADMKQRAIEGIEQYYFHSISVVDGITSGKWTIADWNDPQHGPPTATLEELLMVYYASLLGAAIMSHRVGLLTQHETAEVDRKYREQRPDIFWPHLRAESVDS